MYEIPDEDLVGEVLVPSIYTRPLQRAPQLPFESPAQAVRRLGKVFPSSSLLDSPESAKLIPRIGF